MKVKTTKRFTDLQEKQIRELDDVFEVTKARFEQIKDYVEVVKEVEKEIKKVVKKKAK